VVKNTKHGVTWTLEQKGDSHIVADLSYAVEGCVCRSLNAIGTGNRLSISEWRYLKDVQR
jgi:hypothetical protein